MSDSTINSLHFIGIGGVGMSGIARVAHDQGMTVSGSDIKESRYTQRLAEEGIEVDVGHEADNVARRMPDVVVVSTAIMDRNPELAFARENGIEVWHRARMLAHLGRGRKTLAVAGTHGKTTTSSMLASTVDTLGLDPSFLIGGTVRRYGSNARSGAGEFYVVEADESDKSFTYLDPYGLIVTNVEADHLDHYADLAEIHDKFREFMSQVPAEGHLVVCGDDANLLTLANDVREGGFVTYGFSGDCDYRVEDWSARGVGCAFTLVTPAGSRHEVVLKGNPGRHNAANACAVFALCCELGLDAAEVADAVGQFQGVGRRFEFVDEVAGVTIVDDYAHHPTEIRATIDAAAKLGFGRTVVLFQPHRYSRVKLFTEVLRDDFMHAFDSADDVFFTDVYAAGEMPLPGVTGKTFLDVVRESDAGFSTTYIERRQDVARTLADFLREGDLLITMGAGDVTALGPLVAAELGK